MNSSSAMPISVTLVSCSGSRIRPRSLRPDQRPGDDVAEGRAELQPAEQRDEHQRGAEHDRAAFEDCGGRLRGFGGRRHRADSIAASSARNGSRIAPWRDLRGRAGASAVDAGPVARSRPARCASQRLSTTSASATSSWVRPTRVLMRRSAAEAWPNAQAWTCIDRRSTRRSSSSWTAMRDPAAAGRRAQLGAAVLALERSRFVERCREAQDLGRVERLAHSRRQVVPPGPVLQDDALGLELVADAVGGGEVAVLLGSARSAMRASIASASPPP